MSRTLLSDTVVVVRYTNIVQREKKSPLVYLPVKIPQSNVPQNGVFLLESTLEKISNNKPSDAIEYNILGNGNSVPIILKIKKIVNISFRF